MFNFDVKFFRVEDIDRIPVVCGFAVCVLVVNIAGNFAFDVSCGVVRRSQCQIINVRAVNKRILLLVFVQSLVVRDERVSCFEDVVARRA